MIAISFSWDSAKASANKAKHGVAFEEAQSVFYDEAALLIPDPAHSRLEDRFILMGLSFKLRLLLVCHCYRQQDGVIHIISARKATKSEARQYPR
jgi:uncharacterized DUF497 family protein